MNLLLPIVSLLFLFLLFIQDIKSRSVSVWIFPILILLFGAYSWANITLAEVSLNLIFIAIILTTLLVYVRITKGTYRLTTYLGMGDILFWCCLCVLMSPLNYLLFFTGSLIVTLLVMLAYIFITKKHSITIPLAGIQAALLACFLLIALWVPEADVRQTWINFL